MENGTTFITNYTTKKKDGKVTVTVINNRHFVSFDGLDPIKMTFGIKDGKSTIAVNLKDLHEVGFNCPKVDAMAAILLPSITNHKKMLDIFNVKKEDGKHCGDGLWRTKEQISKMNYTEQVLAGEYSE